MNKLVQTIIHQGIHNVCLIYNQENLWNLSVKKFQSNTKDFTDFILKPRTNKYIPSKYLFLILNCMFLIRYNLYCLNCYIGSLY